MNLQDLSDAFNGLRNDALGRGTTPAVSPALATRLGNTYDRWRAYLANAGVLTDVLADGVAHGWLDQYRELATAVQAEGVKLTAPLPTTFGEGVAKTAAATADFGKTVLLVLAAVALPLTFVLLGGAKRR